MVAIAPTISPLSKASPALPVAAKPSSHLTFDDLLDVINPLQHIPIISTIYRAITGDKMSGTAEIAGGALYGGIIGAVGSVVDVLFKQATGRDVGDTVMAWLGFGNGSDVQYAKTKPAVATPQAVQSAIARTGAVPGLTALSAALAKRNFDPAMARQATLAYENAIGVSTAAVNAELSAR